MGAAAQQNTREIEIKLLLQRRHVKRLRSHPLLAEGFKRAGKAIRQDSVYFDDRNRTLRESGLSLRVRESGEARVQTIKALNGRAGPIDRGEWETVIGSSRPNLSAAAGTPLEPVLRKLRDPLRPMFETRVARTSFPVHFGESEILVAFDRGKIVTDQGAAPICELELELKQGRPNDLFRMALELDGKIPLDLSYETKSGRGYTLLDASASDAVKARPVRIVRGMSCAEAFRTIAHECLRQFSQNREGVIAGNPDSLHQMRIAIRRFRSTLSFFRDIVNGPGAEVMKAELRRLRDATGPARDLDMFVSALATLLREEFPDDREIGRFYRETLRQQAKAKTATRKAVQSRQLRSLIMQMAGWIEVGDWRTDADALTRARQDAPIEIFAAEKLARLRKKIRKHGQLLRELSDEQRHRLRVRVKKLRYATEFYSSLSGNKRARKRTQKMAAALRTLQDRLGALNDAVVHRGLALEIARGMKTRSSKRAMKGEGTSSAAGLIVGRLDARIDGLLDAAMEGFAEFQKAKSFWKLWAPILPEAEARDSKAPAASADPEPAGKPG